MLRKLRPLLGVAALFLTLFVLAPAAQAAPPTPHAPRKLPAAIEPLGGYVGQVTCQPVARRGTVKLARLLASTYRNYGATAWSSTYPCGTDGTRSEHYDGRAIDWMVDIHNKRQHAAAKAAIAWSAVSVAASSSGSSTSIRATSMATFPLPITTARSHDRSNACSA
jgi:hypothetical protein